MMNNQQLLSFSLKGFIFITAGERSVTCGEKVMQLINNSSNNQQQSVQSWMASCLAMTLLRSFRASLQGRHGMAINALRHCDDEERGRSNPG